MLQEPTHVIMGTKVTQKGSQPTIAVPLDEAVDRHFFDDKLSKRLMQNSRVFSLASLLEWFVEPRKCSRPLFLATAHLHRQPLQVICRA